MMSSSTLRVTGWIGSAVCVQPDQSVNNTISNVVVAFKYFPLFPPADLISNTLKWIPSLRTWRLKSVLNGKTNVARVIVLWC